MTICQYIALFQILFIHYFFSNFSSFKVLSNHGDVPSYAVDTTGTVDLTYFPETPLDRDTELHHRVCIICILYFYHRFVRCLIPVLTFFTYEVNFFLK